MVYGTPNITTTRDPDLIQSRPRLDRIQPNFSSPLSFFRINVPNNTMASSGAYQSTARLLNDVWSTHKSLKTLVYDKDGQLTCSKATYALCTKVLQAQSALAELLERVPELTTAVRNQGLLYAVVYELVAGQRQKIQGGGAVKRHVLRHEQALREAWKDLAPAYDDEADEATAAPDDFPRYIRVNTLRATTTEVARYFENDLNLDSVEKDPHIPDLLVVPSDATPAILSSSKERRYDWVLQDKSSCFSAYCLVHGFDDTTGDYNQVRVYIDACAAPGNKTTHLAALAAAAGSDGKAPKSKVEIHAFDRSHTRYESLQRRVINHMPDNGDENKTSRVQVHTTCGDFLETSSNDPTYAHVTDILLDPSCSGSGIFSRQRLSTTPKVKPDRLQALQQFQITALRHAMTAFQHVKRVVYSTCSLHEQENEAVVAAMLQQCGHAWHLVAPKCLATWERRGQVLAGLTPEQAAMLIRVDRPDRTNGFFVACFERSSDEPCVPLTLEESTGPSLCNHAVKDCTAEENNNDSGQAARESSKNKIVIKTNKSSDKVIEPSSNPKHKKKKEIQVDTKRQPAWVNQSGKQKRRKR
eukprot:scaffold10653_cov175-Amphora_coffeaeformis.AAC.8